MLLSFFQPARKSNLLESLNASDNATILGVLLAELALGQFSFRVLRSCPCSLIAPVLHTHSFNVLPIA